MMEIIKTNQDLEAALAASQDHPIVIFKHSATCPFSAMAQMEVANAKHDLDIYGLVVQYVPELSKAVAEQLKTEHASPQAIVVYKGEALDHYWRSEIREMKLRDRVKDITTNA